MNGQPPQGMSSFQRPPLQGAAQQVAAAGRGDDQLLIHVTPDEMRGLASMAPQGKLPINPNTGLPEAGILSAILGVVGTVGGSFVGMPWLGAGLGSFAGGLLEGKSLGSSLGMGVLGGIGAYGMGEAANMLGSAGEGALSTSAAEMAKNGVTAATTTPLAAPGVGAATEAGYGGAAAEAGTGFGGSAAPDATNAAASLGRAGSSVSQFAGAPTVVDASGVAQNFDPTQAWQTKAGNVMEGAKDPSKLWDTFGSNYKKTTLPIAASLYGQATDGFGAFAAPKQSAPQGLQTAPHYPVLPGPNQRTYTPPPADWDYAHGKEWNGWSPAFKDGGKVMPIDGDIAKRLKAPMPARMDGGGPVSGPGGGLDDAIPAVINGRQPAKLSSGEYVVPAHAVSALGDGSTEAGVGHLDRMVGNVMHNKYGTRKPRSIRGGGLRSAAPRPFRAAPAMPGVV